MLNRRIRALYFVPLPNILGLLGVTAYVLCAFHACVTVTRVCTKSSSTSDEAAMLCHHVSHAHGFQADITAGVRSCENTSEKWGIMSTFSAAHFLPLNVRRNATQALYFQESTFT